MLNDNHMDLHGNDMATCRRRMVRDLELFLGVRLSGVDSPHNQPTDETSPPPTHHCPQRCPEPSPQSSAFHYPVYSCPTPEGRPC